MSAPELLRQLAGHLEAGEARPVPLPEDIAARSVEQGSGRLEFSSSALDCLDAFELRVAHFSGPKIEITNFYVYPRPALALPTLGMQTVTMGRRPIVGVVDALELFRGPQRPFPPLAEAKAMHADLGYCDEQPDWFRECRSGADIFLRPTEPEHLERIVAITSALLGEIVTRARSPEPAPDAQAHGREIQAYKDHHRVNSEGLPLMHSRFGEAWTQRFTEEHFFA